MHDRVGTDIVSVSRIARLLDEGGTALLQRWFTPAEIAYCMAKAVPGRHLAARLAAKEAVAKALSWRWDAELPWRCVEIVHDHRGAPAVRLSGRMARLAAETGVGTIEISIAHCDEFATATALAGPTRAAPRAVPDPGDPADPGDRIERVAREVRHLPRRHESPRMAALRMAILLEDCLDIVLTDDELDDPALVADPIAFVRARGAC